jgi:hypothetical protein
MYFDPDWIFTEKPGKDFPNITGLMDDKPKKPRGQKRVVQPVASVADVFNRSEVPKVNRITPIQPAPIPTQPKQDWDVDFYGEPPMTIRERERQDWTTAFADKMSASRKGYLGYRTDGGRNSLGIDYNDYITLQDPKYNIRNNLKVYKHTIDEINKYADAGGLTPEQKLLLAAMANNESEFGHTRDLFGATNYGMDFPGGFNQYPDSYEAKKLQEYYVGDKYPDVINFLKRQTDNFSNMNKANPYHGKEFGESYQDRIKKHIEILMSNPEFMKALYGGQVPQLNLPF